MILVDTGYWLALANRTDKHHARATASLAKTNEELVTTWPVVTETCHLLLRVGVDAETRFIDALARGAARLFELRASHLNRVGELMHKYRDLPMDLADASLVIAAEELGAGRIFSTDMRDFRTYRWKTRKPFTNLLA